MPQVDTGGSVQIGQFELLEYNYLNTADKAALVWICLCPVTSRSPSNNVQKSKTEGYFAFTFGLKPADNVTVECMLFHACRRREALYKELQQRHKRHQNLTAMAGSTVMQRAIMVSCEHTCQHRHGRMSW